MICLRVLLLIGLPFLTGCGAVSYYSQAVRGQGELICKRQRIETVLADPAQPESLKARLRLVNEIRQFAAMNLDLPPGDSYTHYVAIERPMALWVVNAAPEFSLELKSWWYPFVGRFEGRGFFNKSAAESFAIDLRQRGYDVAVSGAPAYSTLGWFADPVLSTFIHFNDANLAELIFHELTHQRLYIPNDTAFNESFATATAQVATLQWLGAIGNEIARNEFAESVVLLNQINGILDNTRKELKILFARSHETPATRRNLKQNIFRTMRTELNSVQNTTESNGIDGSQLGTINNASLGSMAVYHQHVPAFLNLFEQCNQNFPDYFNAVKKIGGLPPAERLRTLEGLRLSAP